MSGSSFLGSEGEMFETQNCFFDVFPDTDHFLDSFDVSIFEAIDVFVGQKTDQGEDEESGSHSARSD